MMSWTSQKTRLELVARAIDPAVVLMTKNGRFWRALAWVLVIVTFGGVSRKRFLENFATTFGPVQAYPEVWSAATVESVIIHESRHTRQARWFGFGISPWVGLPLMGVAYLLFFFPIGLAWVRYRLELDAEVARWRFMLLSGANPNLIRMHAQNFASLVSGRAYFYSWPASWAKWGFVRKAEKIIAK
jgi:hypothetical protein